MSATQDPFTPSQALRSVGRALRLRCPACGQGKLFSSWLAMRPSCPACRRWLEREEGYFRGAMALNLIVAEALPTVAGVLLLILTWPNPPWGFLQIAAPLAMGLTPILFFPFSRALWLALDWTFHPIAPGGPTWNHPRPGTTAPGAQPAAGTSGAPERRPRRS